MKSSFFLIMLTIVIVLAGCSDDVEVSVSFTEAQLIKSGDPVKFNGEVIGEVSEVDELDSGVKIELELDPGKISELHATSAAMVISQPQRYLKIYSNNSGESLQSGAQIRGLNNAMDLATWSAAGVLGSLQGMMNSAAGAFNQYLNSNNWDDLVNQLNDSLSGLSDQSAQSLNQLGGELEKFIKNMQDRSSESLKQADDLSRQLNKELKKFQDQGKDEIAKVLQDMLDAFNSALDPNVVPPSGQEKGEPL